MLIFFRLFNTFTVYFIVLKDLELRKLGRRHAVPSVELVEKEEKQQETPPLSLPLPQRSPRTLQHSQDKLAFMSAIELTSLTRNQRQGMSFTTITL